MPSTTPPAGITLSPSSLAFGTHAIRGPGATLTVTLSNTGTNPATLSVPGISGLDAADLAISSNTCGELLNGGSSCAVTVAFTPLALGDRRAGFLMAINDSLQLVPLSGTGATLNVELPRAVSYGRRKLNSLATTTVSIKNSGSSTVNLNISLVTSGGADASALTVSNGCTGVSLAPGRDCRVTVGFTPRERRLYNAVLVVTSNAPGSPHAVPMTSAGE